MSQMTDDMARNIVAHWEQTKMHYGITAWEECQLARKWLSAADAEDKMNREICGQCGQSLEAFVDERIPKLESKVRWLERDLAAAQEALKNHLHLDNHNAIVRQLEERALAAEERAERNARALDNIESALRKAGATLPAPEVTGTIEGSMNTGLCIALCLVVTERESIAAGEGK